MKKTDWKKLLPHGVAVAIFLVVAAVYCSPALQGKVISQHDITQWKGSIQQSVEYKEVHGQYPLWTNSMFAGMPAFSIGYPANNYIPWFVHGVLTLGLPVPIQFFFLASLCFYFLCQVLRLRVDVSVLGGLAFAYATYNASIIIAGHDTKMWCIAYMPALLGSLLLIYRGRYWIGTALTALFSSILVALNHPQIAYYFAIIAAILTVFQVVFWIKEKKGGHALRAVGFALLGALIGVLTNAVTLMATYEYQKSTIRGGYSELGTPKKGDAATGLSKDYAFDYSMLKAEPFAMVTPCIYGGSSGGDEKGPESKAQQALSSLPQELQQQLPLTYYWGQMQYVAGPPYVGAIVCVLALLSLFLVDRRHTRWAWTAIALAIVMSWGKNFMAFNELLYHYLPLYNKFRAPSMTLVIPQLLLPLLAVLSLNRLAEAGFAESWPRLKKGLIAAGALVAVLLLLYVSFDYTSEMDKNILQSVKQANQPQLTEAVNGFYEGLTDDRKSLFLADILKLIALAAVAFGVVYLMLKRTLKPAIAIPALAIVVLIDLLTVDSRYLHKELFVDKEENLAQFQPSPADQEILKDTSYYRVFNVSPAAFQEAITSYHYNSLGGYNAAKLRIYQDLIEHQLSKPQPNMAVINMLNTKYFIQKDQNGVTQNYQRNDSALGAAWFVKEVRFVKDAKQEMEALNGLDPRHTAVVQQSFRNTLGNIPPADSASVVTLVKNENDRVTYSSNSSSGGLAVFSEIYYNGGWKAFVDGRETPIVKANYVLRALNLPAGNHTIEFRFEPPAYYTGKSITSVVSVILLLTLAFGIFTEIRRRKPASNVA